MEISTYKKTKSMKIVCTCTNVPFLMYFELLYYCKMCRGSYQKIVTKQHRIQFVARAAKLYDKAKVRYETPPCKVFPDISKQIW